MQTCHEAPQHEQDHVMEPTIVSPLGAMPREVEEKALALLQGVDVFIERKPVMQPAQDCGLSW